MSASDSKKELFAKAKRLAEILTSGNVPGASGLPPGVRLETNATANARFPLPLTLTSAVIVAAGVLATMKGHKLIGVTMLMLGGAGIGAAAAAPELNAKLKGSGVQL